MGSSGFIVRKRNSSYVAKKKNNQCSKVSEVSNREDEELEGRMAWERMYAMGLFLRQAVHSEIPKIAKHFKARGVKQILDLGCGSGRHTVFLANQGFEVVGLDIALTGLDATFQQLVEAGQTGHVIASDILQLPFIDRVFDAIISVRVIHHNRLRKIQETVVEMWRVLQPNGLVWITVPVPKNHPSAQGREIEPRTYVPCSGCEKGLPHHLFTEEELCALFQTFSILELQTHQASHYSLLAEKSEK
jgi:ubiquinone/menaquinone biosynthesis C-methylase UbiE